MFKSNKNTSEVKGSERLGSCLREVQEGALAVAIADHIVWKMPFDLE